MSDTTMDRTGQSRHIEALRFGNLELRNEVETPRPQPAPAPAARLRRSGGELEGDLNTPKPMPLEGPLKEELVHEHRNLYCLSYDSCLDFTVQQNWRGWSCQGCPFQCVGAPPQVADFAHARPRSPISG